MGVKWIMNTDDGELYPMAEYEESEKGILGEPISLCKDDYDLKVKVVDEESQKYTMDLDVVEVNAVPAVIKKDYKSVVSNEEIGRTLDEKETGTELFKHRSALVRICIEGFAFFSIGAWLYYFSQNVLTPENLQNDVITLTMAKEIVDFVRSALSTVFSVGMAVKIFDWTFSLMGLKK